MRLTRAAFATFTVLVTALPAGAADVTVVQKNKSFSAPDVAVRLGGRVTFVNADNVTHNLYSSTAGFEFEIRAQEPGRSEAVRFERAGRLLVECAIHPRMKLPVHVQP